MLGVHSNYCCIISLQIHMLSLEFSDHPHVSAKGGPDCHVRSAEGGLLVLEEVPPKISEDHAPPKIHSKAGACKNISMKLHSKAGASKNV